MNPARQFRPIRGQIPSDQLRGGASRFSPENDDESLGVGNPFAGSSWSFQNRSTMDRQGSANGPSNDSLYSSVVPSGRRMRNRVESERDVPMSTNTVDSFSDTE